MSLSSLPAELIRLIGEYTFEGYGPLPLACLVQTCKGIAAICRPILYRFIGGDRTSKNLLPIAYTIFTEPQVALEVRSIEFPALFRYPSSPEQKEGKLERKTKQSEWPPHADHGLIRNQVATALSHYDIKSLNACSSLVCDGTAHDMIAMLIIANTPNLDHLALGPMGLRDDFSSTRDIFRYAASTTLAKLTVVEFGRSPADLPPANEGLSYALFVELFRLPAIENILSNSIAPCDASDIEDETTYLDFVYEIDAENTSLKQLYLSEQLGYHTAHLSHLLKHYPALEHLEFMSDSESYTSGWGKERGAGQLWSIEQFQRALECCEGSLLRLSLGDCLFHEGISSHNQLTGINLRGLNELTHIYLDDNWLNEGSDQPGSWREHNPQLLADMLPEGIQSVSLFHSNNISYKFPECNVHQCCCFEGVIDRYRTGQDFPNLSQLVLYSYIQEEDDFGEENEEWKYFKEVSDSAKAAGLEFWFWSTLYL